MVVAEITNPDDVLITPNAITPNNDGVNDVWNIQGIELLEGHEVIIFNRWGDILYEQSPYTEPWDGTYNGKPVPEATYYYVINLPSHNTVRNGPLTVLR